MAAKVTDFGLGIFEDFQNEFQQNAAENAARGEANRESNQEWIDRRSKENQERGDKASKDANKIMGMALWMFILVLVIVLVISGVIGYLVAKQVSKHEPFCQLSGSIAVWFILFLFFPFLWLPCLVVSLFTNKCRKSNPYTNTNKAIPRRGRRRSFSTRSTMMSRRRRSTPST